MENKKLKFLVPGKGSKVLTVTVNMKKVECCPKDMRTYAIGHESILKFFFK